MADIENLKLILRENDIPFFTDEELEYYLKEAQGDVKNAAYTCLCIKAESTDISANGLTTADMGQYFRRLANMYRPTNSGILKG